MFDVKDDNHTAHALADNNGITITYTDKYQKGCKAKGPRNWKKVNLKSVEVAIKNNQGSVNFWRG